MQCCKYNFVEFEMTLLMFKFVSLQRVALSVLGFIILLATAHELWLTYKNTSFQPTKDGFCLTALNCFSVPTNIRKLVSTKAAVIDNLGCLNGIRVLSTAWIVLYHTYLFACLGFHFPVYNRFMFQEVTTSHICM